MFARGSFDYCEEPGCTFGAEPGERLCLEHLKEYRAREALKGIVVSTPRNIETCPASGHSKHRNRPCVVCKQAREELAANLDIDPYEAFGS